VKSKRGETVTLEPHAKYWSNEPKVTVVWDYVPDSNSRLAALRTGEADIISHVPPEAYESLRGDAEILRYPTYETMFLTLNGQQPRFQDVRVRRAFGSAIDRQSIWRDIMLETGGVRDCHIPFGQLGYAPQPADAIAYDPERARALLAEAGYPLREPVNFIASKGFYPRSEQVVTAVDDQLKQVGVNSVLRISETAKWVDSWFGLKFDVNHHGWAMNVPEPDELWGVWRSGGNSGFSDRRLDALIEQQGRIASQDEREVFLEEKVTPYLWEAMPSIPLYGSELAYGVAQRVRGFAGGQDFNPRFSGITLA
jgi:peptide/nickel transport system substrate-binding protein